MASSTWEPKIKHAAVIKCNIASNKEDSVPDAYMAFGTVTVYGILSVAQVGIS